LEERRGLAEGEEFKPIRRGWCLGEQKFREELLAQMSEQMGAEHYGEERAEAAEALAELIIAEELKLGRWQEADLKTRPKEDSVKVALAARLRAETTMTVGWIAERLAMGTRGYLNHLLYRRRKLGGEFPISRTDPFSIRSTAGCPQGPPTDGSSIATRPWPPRPRSTACPLGLSPARFNPLGVRKGIWGTNWLN
jgi:hypothetical protein